MVEPSNEPTPEPQEFGDLTEIFEKVHRRINEDNASLYADLCEALAITDRQQHRHLVESFVVARSDVFAYYHVFLVPGLLPIEGYRELLEIIQRQAEETLTQQCRLSRFRASTAAASAQPAPAKPAAPGPRRPLTPCS